MRIDKYLTEASVDGVVEDIAKKVLGVKTLRTRNSDELDFYDLAVWKIKDALVKAFEAGQDGKK
jgi:hypothetical protein